MATTNVKFWRGDKAAFNDVTKDNGTIYFVLPDGGGNSGANSAVYLGPKLIAQASGSDVAAVVDQLFGFSAEKGSVKTYVDGKVTTINASIDAINTKIGTIAPALGANIGAALNGLNTRLSTAETQVATNKTDITTLKSGKLDVTKYNTDMGAAPLGTNDKTVKGAINEVKGTADSALRNANANTSAISSANSLITGLQSSKVDKSVYDTAIGSGDMGTSAPAIKPAIKELKGITDGHGGRISTAESKILTLETSIGNVNNAFVFKQSISAADLARVTAKQGYAYVASGAVTVGGITMENGDMLIVTADVGTGKLLNALTAAEITVLERNLNGAIVRDGAAGSDADRIAVFGSGNGIKSHISVTDIKNHANTAASNAKSEAIGAAAGDATTKAEAAREAAIGAAAGDATTKAEAAKKAAIGTAAIDATNKANDAEANAKTHANGIVAPLIAALTWGGV